MKEKLGPSGSVFLLLLLASIAAALLNVYWPLCLVVYAATVAYTPVPRIMQSLFGRLFVGLMTTAALFQCAALIQLIWFSHSNFAITGTLFAVLSAGFIFLFGVSPPRSWKVIRKTDVFLLATSALFLLYFVPVIMPMHGSEHAVAAAGEQIVDSVTHWDNISKFTVQQNISTGQDFKGAYYPSGFHITVAFFEVAFHLGNSRHAWLGNVVMYYAQYAVCGLILLASIIYFGYCLLERMYEKGRPKTWMYGAAALSVGGSSILLHAILFVNEGFLNYFYACAALLLGMAFLIKKDELRTGKEWGRARPSYPLSMFLLSSFGTSLSYPLFTPAILLTAALSFTYPQLKHWYSSARATAREYWPCVLLVAVHLLAVYIQIKFGSSDSSNINVPGALHNFNVVLFMAGLGVVAVAIFTNQAKVSRLFTALFAPFLLLTAAIMLYQYFTLGQASYYLIKESMIVEMFTIVIISVDAILLTERGADLSAYLKFCWSTLAVFCVVVATIGTLPQPLVEARNVYRSISGVSEAPYVGNDAAAIARLGRQDRINHYNLTILHYVQTSHFYNAQIEPALWANSMSTSVPTALTGDKNGLDERAYYCSYKIDVLLIHGIATQSQQGQLLQAIRDCASLSRQLGVPFYVVTDPGSISALRKDLGSTVSIAD